MIIFQLGLAVFMAVAALNNNAPQDVWFAWAAGFFAGVTIAQAISIGLRKLLSDD